VWALGGAGRPYALALLQAVAFFSQARPALPATASGVGQVTHLRRRLTMIMQGTTPRSLSRTGLLAVLGLGLLLLPALPGAAQQAPGEPAQARPQDSRAEQIKVLQNLIKSLEAQQPAERHRDQATPQLHLRWSVKEPPSSQVRWSINEAPVAAEVKDIAESARRLARQIADRRRELQELEARYAEISAKLRRLAPDQVPQDHRLKPAGPQPKPDLPLTRNVPQAEKDLKAWIAPRLVEPQAAGPAAQRSATLEQRLDRLLREVEELKREIRREKPNQPARR
jgi:hypothetical protein